jgi:sulfotransferase family protein
LIEYKVWYKDVMLPTFLVIGAVKSGTTSLYQYLRSHPEVYVSEVKELNFFVAESVELLRDSVSGAGRRAGRRRSAGNWSRGLEWYEDQFAEAGGARAIGEVSPRYAQDPRLPGVPERIANLLPNVKLVYLVRDPIKRMVSHYLHLSRSIQERRELELALEQTRAYLDASRYAHQIEQYLNYFPRDQLLVVISERLRVEREQTLARVFDFIGVDAGWRDEALSEEHHISAGRRSPRGVTAVAMKSPWWDPVASRFPEPTKRWGRQLTHRPAPEPTVSPELQLRLENRLRDDVARLHQYVDEDFDGWGIA